MITLWLSALDGELSHANSVSVPGNSAHFVSTCSKTCVVDERLPQSDGSGIPDRPCASFADRAGFLASIRDRVGAMQLLVAWAASYVCTQLAKSFIERPRPAAIPALADATGFSFPSGHALMTAAIYVTIALIVCRRLQLPSQRIVLVLSSTAIILVVALSRVYLGVHYPSDIVGGTLLGVGLSAGSGCRLSVRRSRHCSISQYSS